MASDKEIEKWIIRLWGLILLGFGIAIGWQLHPSTLPLDQLPLDGGGR